MATASKTTCPITRDRFRSHAKPIAVEIAGMKQAAIPKEFSTGSLGWNLNGKTVIEINGVPCTCQVGVNITLVGSKDVS
jgi:hypothetical protein